VGCIGCAQAFVVMSCLFPLLACPCRYLSADDNNLSGTLCSCFSTLTALNSFYVAGNLFSGTIPTTFSNMANLQCVHNQQKELAGGCSMLRSHALMLVEVESTCGQGRVGAIVGVSHTEVV
jgi:hypothetical protein